jgi:hypothetical protein
MHDGSLKTIDRSPPGAPPRSRRYEIHRDDEVAWIEARKQRTRPSEGRRSSQSSRTRSFRALVK